MVCVIVQQESNWNPWAMRNKVGATEDYARGFSLGTDASHNGPNRKKRSTSRPISNIMLTTKSALQIGPYSPLGKRF